jgi:hypothetical protein
MKKLLLLIILFAALGSSQAQTATNFTCNDCSGVSHDLFSECDAGNVVVLCWVMPCNSCVGGALTCNNVCQSFPNNVLFYVIDDYGNTNCTSLNSWATSNNITPTATFSNASIDMLDYGSTGMPKAVVIGGPNHTVFYNANNSFNGTAIQTAINQAMTATTIKEEDMTVSSISVYPVPARDICQFQFPEAGIGNCRGFRPGWKKDRGYFFRRNNCRRKQYFPESLRLFCRYVPGKTH